MKNTFRKFVAALLLLSVAACSTPSPVAVPCPELPPVSQRMMAPAKNAPLLMPSSPMPQKTLTR